MASDGTAFDETVRQQIGLTSDLLHTFLDWRHKVMTRFAVVVAAIIIGINHLYEVNAPDWLIVAAHLAGAGMSFSALLMDRTNQRVLHGCYRTGTSLEDSVGVPGVFHQLECIFVKRRDWHSCDHLPNPQIEAVFREESPKVLFWRIAQYRKILFVVYSGATLAFTAAAIVEIVGDALRRPVIYVSNPCRTDILVDQLGSSRHQVIPTVTVRPGSTHRAEIERKVSKLAIRTAAGTRLEVDVAAMSRHTYVVPATECPK